MTNTRRALRAGALVALSFLTACQTIRPLFVTSSAETHQDVANVYVSALPPVPWTEISEKLEPKHNLTTEQARGLAAVTTQAQVAQFLSAFSIGLGLGLPQRSYLQSSTSDADGETVTTTRSRGTGTAPTSSGAAAAGISDASLAADFSKSPFGFGLDASTLLQAGTAVYQLGAILDNQISKAYLPSGYHAHLLTFQVALQPRTRTLAYDVHVDLTLQPADWKAAVASSEALSSQHGAMPPIVVYPLVISDAMESSSTARSVEIMRQAALSLSGVVGRVGASFGANSGTTSLDSVIGQVRNSLVTVGRMSDHALRVRIGAQNSGEAGYALVPRTYNISVVVLSRWPLVPTDAEPQKKLELEAQQIKTLSIFADSDVVPVQGGEPLKGGPTRHRPNLAERVHKVVTGLGFTVRKDCSPGIEDKANVEYPLDLLRAVDRQDYAHVRQCLRLTRLTGDAALLDDLQTGDRIRLERVISGLMKIQADASNSKLFVPLRARETPQLPTEKQLVALKSDESGVTATLRGGTALRAEGLSGAMNLEGKQPILASSIVVKDRSEITLTFPPLADFNVEPDFGAPPKPAPATTQAAKPKAAKPAANGAEAPKAAEEPAAPKAVPVKITGVVLSYKSPDAEVTLKDKIYHVAHVRVKEKEPEKAAAPISVAQAVLVPDENGVARISVNVAEAKGYSGAIRLQVSGADVREESAPKPGAEGKVDAAQKSVARLVLGNLTPLKPVSVTAFKVDPATKKDVKFGEALVLQVAR